MRPLPWYVALAVVFWATCCAPSVVSPPDLAHVPPDAAYARPDGLLTRGAVCCECAPRVLVCDGCRGVLDLPRWCWYPCGECLAAIGVDAGSWGPVYEAAKGEADEARCRAGCPLE